MKSTLKASLTIGAVTFLISVVINISSNALLAASPLTISFLLLFFIVLFGIIADIIGTAAAAGQENPYHAMASNKIPGARQSIWLVRNADRVASFANDVIGDIAGTVSGAIGAAIVFQLMLGNSQLNEQIINTFFIALIAAVTVGGKALGKSLAITRSKEILFLVGKFLYVLEKIGIRMGNPKKNKKKSSDVKNRK